MRISRTRLSGRFHARGPHSLFGPRWLRCPPFPSMLGDHPLPRHARAMPDGSCRPFFACHRATRPVVLLSKRQSVHHGAKRKVARAPTMYAFISAINDSTERYVRRVKSRRRSWMRALRATAGIQPQFVLFFPYMIAQEVKPLCLDVHHTRLIWMQGPAQAGPAPRPIHASSLSGFWRAKRTRVIRVPNKAPLQPARFVLSAEVLIQQVEVDIRQQGGASRRLGAPGSPSTAVRRSPQR